MLPRGLLCRPVPPGARRARSVSLVGRGRGGELRRCYGSPELPSELAARQEVQAGTTGRY
eukprot:943108-Prorocentrum_minimum.AAC.1